MDLLKRHRAPILAEAWKLIDREAERVLRLQLAGRKLVDLDGPHGWKWAAVNTGRVMGLKDPPIEGVTVGLRAVVPLLEVRAAFVLDIDELDSVARGAEDPDLGTVVTAAEKVARFEDDAIFNGNSAAGIVGIIPSSPHAAVEVASPEAWPSAVARAKEVLKSAGIGGPFALAAGKPAYDELSAASEDGYPLKKRVEQIVEGPIVWAPEVRGAVLLSTRGGDYELSVGQDLSIGYSYSERSSVALFLAESFTFRVLEPTAAVLLRRS
jgi:uncharacterized linocin/CFP29 family protein